MNFRERDGMCIQYEVRGIPDSVDFPYVNDLTTLKAAIEIGRTYPDIYSDGSATHIVRRYSKLLEPGKRARYESGFTHRWRVDRDGRLQLLVSYSRTKERRHENLHDFAKSLPKLKYPAASVHTQLADLAVFAEAMGLVEAADAISRHVYGWSAMPQFCQFKSPPIAAEKADSYHPVDRAPVDAANDSLWKRFAYWVSALHTARTAAITSGKL